MDGPDFPTIMADLGLAVKPPRLGRRRARQITITLHPLAFLGEIWVFGLMGRERWSSRPGYWVGLRSSYLHRIDPHTTTSLRKIPRINVHKRYGTKNLHLRGRGNHLK